MLKNKLRYFYSLNADLAGNALYLNKNYLNVNAVVKSGVKYLRCSTVPNAKMTANTEYPVGTLPEEFAPTYAISQEVRVGTNKYIRLNIQTTGDFKIVPLQDIAVDAGINLNFTYV